MCFRLQKRQRKVIAFHANLMPSLQNLPTNTTLKFDEVLLNKGDGYDSNTGIFTECTPSTGLLYQAMVELYIYIGCCRQCCSSAYMYQLTEKQPHQYIWPPLVWTKEREQSMAEDMARHSNLHTWKQILIFLWKSNCLILFVIKISIKMSSNYWMCEVFILFYFIFFGGGGLP